ncbi:unnamed protein product [Lactuca saligna]|uniref:Transcriptional coactivator Hfi1/Transcriptional adapter 1 n=1 Tax=Lactuca saligna TaxID=75948 RepID=A0AA36E4L3_LACSI|nr:unnamed protein product [Lactuca saligna]
MPAVRCFSRIDTFEIKVEIGKRLGAQKAEKYFNLLTRYLSQKLRKPEFDKHCVALIGRENLHLHNELIISIIKNASFSNTPPQKHFKSNTPLTLKLPNGSHPRTSLQSLCAFPQSPKKGRTPNLRERKFKDRSLHENTRTDFQTIKLQQQQQQQQQSVSLSSKPPPNNSDEDGEEVYSRSPVRAPFGINLHSKETRKVLNTYTHSDSAYHTETCHYSGQLPASNSLNNRLKHNLKTEGLDISMDCVDLLNNGLDSFLKRVIKLTHLRSSSESISMLDFRVATELNPMILGDVSHIVHENC